MLTGQKYKNAVYGFWANSFGCLPEDFSQTCTWVKKQDDMRDSGTCVLYHMGAASIIRIDPALAERIGLSGGMYPQPIAMTITELQGLAGDKYSISVKSTLLDHFIDPKDFKVAPYPEGFTPRYLDAEKDKDTLLGFYGQCSAKDLDEADIIIEEPDPVIFGLFDGEHMAAYSSHRYWENTLADIGVLVHKDYRKRGLGTAVVSELCQYCFDHDIVPMYRAFDYNTGSLRIPHALGFEMLLTVKSLKIE